MIKRNLVVITGAVLLVGFFGCEDRKKKVQQARYEKEIYSPFQQTSAIPAKQVILPDYRLNIGDQLEIIFHVRHLTTEEYRFHTEDIITIKFPYHPTYDQTVVIQPDGKVRLLLLGEIDAFESQASRERSPIKAGKSVKNLEAELKQKYSEYFKDADLTITFQSANIKIEELKKAITTAPRGQSRLMPVKPDGKITLPFLTDTLAYGKTIEELKSELDNKYQNDAGIPELEVTVQILAVAPRKIYVFGEVNRPGIIEVSNMITLTQAVAIAGGTNTRADSTKILVVRRKDMPSPEGVVVDLDQMLSSIIKVDGIERPDAKKWTRDFWLDDYDLVYVPTSSMTKSNDWINQVFTRGIYSVVPFSTSVNMGFGYQTYNAPSAYSNNNAGKEQLGNLANTILSR